MSAGSREEKVRALYRAHLLFSNALLGTENPEVPTTRNDLREFYSAIIDGKIEAPVWAAAVLNGESL